MNNYLLVDRSRPPSGAGRRGVSAPLRSEQIYRTLHEKRLYTKSITTMSMFDQSFESFKAEAAQQAESSSRAETSHQHPEQFPNATDDQPEVTTHSGMASKHGGANKRKATVAIQPPEKPARSTRVSIATPTIANKIGSDAPQSVPSLGHAGKPAARSSFL